MNVTLNSCLRVLPPAISLRAHDSPNLRFQALPVVSKVKLTLQQAPQLRQLLESIESAISLNKVEIQSIEQSGFSSPSSHTFVLKVGEITLQLQAYLRPWTLQVPSQNLVLKISPGDFLIDSTEVCPLKNYDFSSYHLKGFWDNRRVYKAAHRLSKWVNKQVYRDNWQQVYQQQQTALQPPQNNQAKTTMKDLLQTQINLLTAKQDHYQPLIQNLARQYADAQTYTETAIGRERAEALREQLAKAQEKDREHRQDTLKAIAELQEKQVRLELTENNEALLRMMDESKALIRASEERMQGVGNEIDVNYETTRILLAPATSEATARVQERVQARLAEPAATSPSSVETAIAAASSKSRQTAEASH